jgi:F-type H+-transporting ATPase subunit b
MGAGRLALGLLASVLVLGLTAEVSAAGKAAQGHAEGEHAGEHHAPHFSDINWFDGFLGEKAGVEPSVLWRAPGTPVPVGALLLNTAVLFYLFYRFGKEPVQRGLKARRERILKGIQDAARMKAEAESQLAHYEEKLAHIEQEIDRVKAEMQRVGALERERILKEARERRERMEKDARHLILQELKAARHLLLEQSIVAATTSAGQLLAQKLSEQDHQRLAQDYLKVIADSRAVLSQGGRA